LKLLCLYFTTKIEFIKIVFSVIPGAEKTPYFPSLINEKEI